jgi:uncharacterized protein with NRDE domain
MCVVAIGLESHPRWQLVVAGNRDEFHARASAPLARWDDGSGIIAGRDLVSGGSWLGVSEAGRLAVVTNIRNADGPDPNKLSRGALVTDWLAHGAVPDDPNGYNPFNLFVAEGLNATYLANRPQPSRTPLAAGIHGFSNAIPDGHWPRKNLLVQELGYWLDQRADCVDALLDLLGDESIPDPDGLPIFIRNPVYGTRCSTVILVDAMDKGRFIERRYDAEGANIGETALDFRWPANSV